MEPETPAAKFERETFDFPAPFWWGWYWVLSAVFALFARWTAVYLSGSPEPEGLLAGALGFYSGALWMLGLEQKDRHRERKGKTQGSRMRTGAWLQLAQMVGGGAMAVSGGLLLPDALGAVMLGCGVLVAALGAATRYEL